MKVSNDAISNGQTTPKQPVQATSPPSRDVAAQGASKDAKLYTPSPEWLLLLEKVGQQPDVREDLVQAALARLGRGEYATPASAVKTAEAMLNSLD